MAREAAQLAAYSFVVTLINIVCICMMGGVVLLIKKVVPVIPDDDMSECSCRFYCVVHSMSFLVRVWRSNLKKARVANDNNIKVGMNDQNVRELSDVWKTIDDGGGFQQRYKEHDV